MARQDRPDAPAREQYRRAARWYRGSSGKGENIRVETHANVSPCEDGAYVDAVIFVPDTIARHEKES